MAERSQYCFVIRSTIGRVPEERTLARWEHGYKMTCIRTYTHSDYSGYNLRSFSFGFDDHRPREQT